MYPTFFKIPYLPEWLAAVKAYGVMMMIAFLTGIWLATRRAMKVQANPDVVLNVGFISLVAGVIGARAMFVLHYWDSRFANQPNPIAAVFDIRAGGLEFWGGPLLTIPALIIYMRYFAKVSARWYLDITGPSLAWGLAVTRIGCFLNGCCWGSTCVDEHDPSRNRAAVPWAVRFPYGSAPMAQQYRFGQLTLPKELIYSHGAGESIPFPQEYIEEAVKDDGKLFRARAKAVADARAELDAANKEVAPAADSKKLQELQDKFQRAMRQMEEHYATPVGFVDNHCRRFQITPPQLAELASHYRSKPVHPAQLYEMISGFLISFLLTAMFYYRSRHGIIIPWFLILYSISRLLLEAIRQDNPLDVLGVTISQAISIFTFAVGVIWLLLLYLRMPVVSPRLQRFEFEEEGAPPAARPA